MGLIVIVNPAFVFLRKTLKYDKSLYSGMQYKVTYGAYEECQDDIATTGTPELAVQIAKTHAQISGVPLYFYHIELIGWED